MGKSFKKKKNNKRVAHTSQDNRYARKNIVRMQSCPSCHNKGCLVENMNDGYVWAYCNTCHTSGENEKVKDNLLTAWQEVYTTIVDTFHQ